VSEEWLKAASRPIKVAQVDPSLPNVARVWNYLVGGRDNFEADRQAAKQLVAAAPVMEQVAPASRAFLRRAVTFLAAEAGIRQFLDIGTGIPTPPNVHEAAQSIAPHCRVVYVDNDPIVLAHARALLTGTPEGITAYIDADLREPGKIIEVAQKTLDFSQPIAVIIVGTLHLISEEEQPYPIVARLLDAVPSGSYLLINHPASDIQAHVVAEGAKRYNQSVATPQTRRDHAEVARFFGGLELLSPGVVQTHRWRPEPGDSVPEQAEDVSAWAGVGRKP